MISTSPNHGVHYRLWTTQAPICMRRRAREEKPRRASWICGWGGDKLKIVLWQGCISAAETTSPRSDNRHEYIGHDKWTKRLILHSIAWCARQGSPPLILRFYSSWKHSDLVSRPMPLGECAARNFARSRLAESWKTPLAETVGVILPQAPQPLLAFVGADPSLPRSTLVHRILP